MATAPSSSASMRRSHVLPLRDEPKIQTRRSSLSARLNPFSLAGRFIGGTGRVREGYPTGRQDKLGRRPRGPAPPLPSRPSAPRGPGGRIPSRLRGADRRLALLGVHSLRELLHDLRAERVEVVGLAAGD